MKDKIIKIKENYERELNEILIKGIRNNEITVCGSLTGLSIHSVRLYSNDNNGVDSNFLCEIWTENIDEELSSLKEYGYEPILLKENRKEIFEYIKNNLNK